MGQHTIALFGEAERGEFRTAYFCRDLEDLVGNFGNPPEESQGLFCAVQALLHERQVIFIRVQEEGFSQQDYFSGLRLLQNQQVIPELSALCLPGVGDGEIIEATTPLCQMYNSILMVNESDMYDYLSWRG